MIKRIYKHSEALGHNTVWQIKKYKNDEDYKNNKPYTIENIYGNLCLNVGINLLWKMFAGDKPVTEDYYDNTHAYICVGNGSDAEAASQTTLQGGTIATKGMDVGYPSYGTDQKIVFKSTFGTSDANFDWQEFGIANGDISISNGEGVLFNRKISDKGVKQAGETWEVTLTITLS